MFTPEQQEEIRKIIQNEFQEFLASDRYIFHKTIQILEGRNIQTGRATGTEIGTATDQKIGFYGKTPVVQQTGIAEQKVDYTAGDLDTEAEVIAAFNTTNTAINVLRTALNNLGITNIV